MRFADRTWVRVECKTPLKLGQLNMQINTVDRLMVETDAPYLKPRNLKPRVKTHRNEPRWLPWIVGTLAATREEHPGIVAQQTTANARAFFNLPVIL